MKGRLELSVNFGKAIGKMIAFLKFLKPTRTKQFTFHPSSYGNSSYWCDGFWQIDDRANVGRDARLEFY